MRMNRSPKNSRRGADAGQDIELRLSSHEARARNGQLRRLVKNAKVELGPRIVSGAQDDILLSSRKSVFVGRETELGFEEIGMQDDFTDHFTKELESAVHVRAGARDQLSRGCIRELNVVVDDRW